MVRIMKQNGLGLRLKFVFTGGGSSHPIAGRIVCLKQLWHGVICAFIGHSLLIQQWRNEGVGISIDGVGIYPPFDLLVCGHCHNRIAFLQAPPHVNP